MQQNKGKVGNVVFKHNTTLARNEKMFLPSLPGHSILKLPNLLKACCSPAERKHNINHHIDFKLENMKLFKPKLKGLCFVERGKYF